MEIFAVPSDIMRNTFVNFLSLQDFARLDSATTQRNLRCLLMEILNGIVLGGNLAIPLGGRLLRWSSSRNVGFRNVKFGRKISEEI